ncbi:hypothetical protein ABZP36_014495 [Zizania latifolia]
MEAGGVKGLLTLRFLSVLKSSRASPPSPTTPPPPPSQPLVTDLRLEFRIYRLQDFDEYLDLQSRTFAQLYRCRPISLIKTEDADDNGNRIYYNIVLLFVASGHVHIEYPMQFQIQNASTLQTSYCGVLEFVADEGFTHMPTRMMDHLGLEENDLVLLRSTSLPKATFVKLQPHTADFLAVSDPRHLLEYNFGKYVCLTTGETITVTEGEKKYYLDVVETRPADAICTIETDCEVEFEQPLDYKEPVPAEIATVQADEEPVRFAGVGMRIDGKPMKENKRPPQPQPRTGAPAAADARPKRVFRFGPPAAASNVKEEAAGEEDDDKRFIGQKYSLKD